MGETYAEITSHGCHSESQGYGECQRELVTDGRSDRPGRMGCLCSEFLW
jgi:hypothetical protein